MNSPIILVSCVKLKNQRPSAAKDLYCSTLFKEMRRFAESKGGSWGILSAKYGLLMPDDQIEPYELTLNTMRKPQRQSWSSGVWQRLEPQLKPDSTVVFLAGVKYREFLVDNLLREGHRVLIPMEGIRSFTQVSWLQNEGKKWEPA